jgi:hypothetical protein
VAFAGAEALAQTNRAPLKEGAIIELGGCRVTFQTLTPNFKEFQVRRDSGSWSPSGDTLLWDIHPGLNRLEAKTVNQFGVDGPISTVEVEQ